MGTAVKHGPATQPSTAQRLCGRPRGARHDLGGTPPSSMAQGRPGRPREDTMWGVLGPGHVVLADASH